MKLCQTNAVNFSLSTDAKERMSNVDSFEEGCEIIAIPEKSNPVDITRSRLQQLAAAATDTEGRLPISLTRFQRDIHEYVQRQF